MGRELQYHLFDKEELFFEHVPANWIDAEVEGVRLYAKKQTPPASQTRTSRIISTSQGGSAEVVAKPATEMDVGTQVVGSPQVSQPT